MPKRKPTRRSPKKKKSSNLKWLFASILFISGGIALYYYATQQIVKKKNLTPEQFSAKIPKGYKSVGLDISHHQGVINWEELFQQKGFDTIIDFVYCKATEGEDHTDTQWIRNREQLNKLGVLNGAYHYFNPKGLPKPQAQHFLSQWKIRTIDLPPVIDVEDEGFSDEDLIAKVRIWCDEIRKKTGIKPIIYTSLNFYETKFRGKFSGYQFWLAAYSREPQFMDEKEVIHWQFSETGKLPGIKELVDLNVSKVEF